MEFEGIAARLESFVRSRFDIDPSDTVFDRTVDLYDLGYVDSVGFAELLAFISKEFGIDIPEDDLLSDDFLKIDGIATILGHLITNTVGMKAY